LSVFISGPDDGNKRENTLAGIVMNRDIRTHVWIVSFDKERYRGPLLRSRPGISVRRQAPGKSRIVNKVALSFR